MKPTLKHGQYVVVSSLSTPKIGDVVVAVQGNKEVIKRVVAIKNDWLFDLRGDNSEDSVDSRDYGHVTKRMLQGVVVWPRVKKLQ
jgi:signal peptidase I